jgi:hypothetical protein
MPIVEDVSGIMDASNAMLYVDTYRSRLGGMRPLAPGRGRVCATALRAGTLLSIDFGLLYCDSFHQVVEVPIYRLRLGLVWLRDRSKHHGFCNHVLPGVEELLCTITAFCDLVTFLPHPGLFSFEVPLNSVVWTVPILKPFSMRKSRIRSYQAPWSLL